MEHVVIYFTFKPTLEEVNLTVPKGFTVEKFYGEYAIKCMFPDGWEVRATRDECEPS